MYMFAENLIKKLNIMKSNLGMKTIKSAISLLILFFLSCQLFAQSGTSIKGKASITDGDFYYVILLSVTDSSMITSAFFDTPDFEIKNIKEKTCLLQIASPMLFKTYSTLIDNSDNKSIIDVGVIQLEPKENILKEVHVVATPPTIKFTEGKFVYNIQNNKDFKTLDSFNDILKRLPLVSVDNDKISVFGKKNTVVLINGIPPKNDNWELIQPENIKEVEVITNPSAEYSASGMAVINIITKKKVA